MKFKIGVLSSKKLVDAIKNIATGYEHQYKQHLAKGVMLVRNEAIKSIRTSSGGDMAFRYGPKRVVRVSKPGDAPNTDFGTLIKSIGWNIDETNMIGEVGTNLEYGKHLEFGTQNMAARPWLQPALERARPQLVKIFRKGRGQRKVSGDGS